METKDFYFDLPQDLIAQHPTGTRGEDKLLFLQRKTGEFKHYMMQNLVDLIEPGTVMVFNNSKVRRARVYGKRDGAEKETEFLFLENLKTQNARTCGTGADADKTVCTATGADADNLGAENFGAEKAHAGQDTSIKNWTGSVWRAMVKNAKRQKVGHSYTFADGTKGVILQNALDEGTEFRTIGFFCTIDESWFEKNGHIPLPPYIKRADVAEDSSRYQTIYAKEVGSAAAPTAGLHFTDEILGTLKNKGVCIEYVTLHVGLGTFLPVRTSRIEDHTMHTEVFNVSTKTAQIITNAKNQGKPILAVGTTSLRTLESAWSKDEKRLISGTQATSIFIYPGYKFGCVDRLFTNFHTPESTLLMLVSAFAGKDAIFSAYQEAINKRYRFFSYGDAMLIG